MEKTGGAFARSYIERIYQTYMEKSALIEADPENKANRLEQPYQEMETILNDFFVNDELNNEYTMVTGEDLCKMFDVCLFFGEQINTQRCHVIATGQKLAKKIKLLQKELAEANEALSSNQERQILQDEEAFNLANCIEANKRLVAENIDLNKQIAQLHEQIDRLFDDKKKDEGKLRDL